MRNTFLLGLAMLLAGPVAAQDQTPCFCLLNSASQMIERWGCEARLIESRGIERVRCQKEDFDGWESMNDIDRFTRIPEGEGQCKPCYQSERGPLTPKLDPIREGLSKSKDNPEAGPANE